MVVPLPVVRAAQAVNLALLAEGQTVRDRVKAWCNREAVAETDHAKVPISSADLKASGETAQISLADPKGNDAKAAIGREIQRESDAKAARGARVGSGARAVIGHEGKLRKGPVRSSSSSVPFVEQSTNGE